MSRFPGPKSEAALRELRRYVISEPEPFMIDLARCHDMFLATVDGDELFDWAGYYGSRLLGHNHPALREPEYLERLSYAANNKVPNPDYLTQECLEYYRLMYRLAPKCLRGDGLEVYVVNSGAEAVENLMKYLLARHREKLTTQGQSVEARRFIYFDRAFHGRTLGALNVTHLAHSPVVTAGFSELIPGNIRAEFPHWDSSRTEAANRAELEHCLGGLERTISKYGAEIVGVLAEPIQGAGGHRLAHPEFFPRLSQLCHERDVFLAFDEVQTAGGPCGDLFAVDLFSLPHPPEAVAVAKKFGNGVLFMRQSLLDIGVLDSTWGGSLTDMVRVVKEFEIVESNGLLSMVAEKGSHLEQGLQRLERQFTQLMFNVRGLGLYQGFSLRTRELRNRLIDTALEQENLLLLGAGTYTIRLRPPLDVTKAHIDDFLQRLERSLSTIA